MENNTLKWILELIECTERVDATNVSKIIKNEKLENIVANEGYLVVEIQTQEETGKLRCCLDLQVKTNENTYTSNEIIISGNSSVVWNKYNQISEYLKN